MRLVFGFSSYAKDDYEFKSIDAHFLRFIQSTMTKIKDRNRRKAALSDRKSAIAQARMKSIANLAADDRVPKKRRKAGAGMFFL